MTTITPLPTRTYDDLEINLICDAGDWLESLGRAPTAADMTQANDLDIRVDLFGESFVLNNQNDTWCSKMTHWIRDDKKMTQSQLRVVLKVARSESFVVDVMGQVKSSPKSEPKPLPVAVPTPEVYVMTDEEGNPVECYQCGDVFDTFDELQNHRAMEHGSFKTEPERTSLEIPSRGIAVIADTTSTTGLDISDLPDGRYAAPDPRGKQSLLYLQVKRVRRAHFRDRRYRYGKITTGSEVVQAGTIEVREWTSDQKELVGEQRPGDVYRGKFEKELTLIGIAPAEWAKVFGVTVGRCCICGKTLTDDLSKEIGMGFECEKKEAYFKTKPESMMTKCPNCKGTDLVLHYIDKDGRSFYDHLDCGCQFYVDKHNHIDVLAPGMAPI